MAVTIGSARLDENGNARGGKAGDQTGREVGTQSWYLHGKGWRVFRPRDPAQAEKIAQDMRWACDNSNIGYDQGQRLTLYNIARPLGFNCSKVTTKCETDCSALVRVCCAYAGISLPDFNTVSEASALLKSGAFTEMTGTKYTGSGDYLRRGDVLVTKTKGHTVVVLSDGGKAGRDAAAIAAEHALGWRILKNGCEGADVRELQTNLIRLGYSCGNWGADGDFGDATEQAVRRFQTQEGLVPDGEFGPLSLAAMNAALERLNATVPEPKFVKIVGGNCYVRSTPVVEKDNIRGIAHDGDRLPYARETSADGWLKVMYKDKVGWVSGKYGRVVE